MTARAACLSSAAGCAAHEVPCDALRAIVDALPRCRVCARHATRVRAVGLGRWHLCDGHGEPGTDLPYADALRAAGLA